MKLTRKNELVEDGEIVSGRWQITPGHDIRYVRSGRNEEVKVSGSLIAAEPGALVIAVTEKQSDQKIVTGIYKLTGTWRADHENRLVFEVQRERGASDALTLRSAWKLDAANRIVYGFKQKSLKTRKTRTQELSLDGWWDLTEKNRLTYLLGGDTTSALRFRGAFQTSSILAKRGEIRYQLGVEASRGKRSQTLVLFGKWKISRDLGLSFELASQSRKRTFTFGAEYALGDDASIEVRLTTRQGDPLGVNLALTRDFFGKDGKAFIELQKSLAESRVEAGMSFRW